MKVGGGGYSDSGDTFDNEIALVVDLIILIVCEKLYIIDWQPL